MFQLKRGTTPFRDATENVSKHLHTKEMPRGVHLGEECNHSKYNGRCIICVQGSGRNRAHFRHKSSAKIGELADTLHFDLAEFTGKIAGNTQPHQRVLVAVHSTGAMVAIPVKSKGSEDLTAALQQAILIMEQKYKLPLITRVHSDEEPGIHKNPEARIQLAAKAIRLTCAPGFGSARAEGTIAFLAGKARAAMFEAGLAEDLQPIIWPYAMAHAAYVQNTIKITEDLDSTKPIPAFLQIVYVPTKDPSRGQPRYVRAAYLGPEHNYTRGGIVLTLEPTESDKMKIRGIHISDEVRPLYDTNQKPVFSELGMAAGFNKTRPLRVAHSSCIPPVEGMTADYIKEQLDKIKKDLEVNSIHTTQPEPEEVLPRFRNYIPQFNVTELYKGPSCQESKKCLEEEIQKLNKFETFEQTPTTLQQLRSRKDKRADTIKVVKVKGIVSIKNAEEPKAKQEWKGRVVAMGNFVRNRWLQKVPDDTVWAPTSSMAAMKFVVSRSVLQNEPLESIDLSSAYLQAPILEEEGEWYVILDEDTENALPEKERKLCKKMKHEGQLPVHKLNRSLYGRCASGTTWIRHFLKSLEEWGYSPSHFDKALWSKTTDKGEVWVAVYVDDMLATGPPDELARFWREVQSKYIIKEGSQGSVQKFIGVQFKHKKNCVSLCMEDYARRIVEGYEQEWDIKLIPKATPCTTNLYEEAGIIRSQEKDFKKLKPKQVKKLQEKLGELLWLSRTTRHDIAFATVQIAARVTCWSDECDVQLQHLIAYLKKYPALTLDFEKNEGDTWSGSIMHVDSDASLALPRSQTGLLYYILTASGKIMVIDWASRSQKLAATSSCAAETVAGHEAIINAIPYCEHVPGGTIVHRTDNSAFLHNIKRGYTERLAYLQKALQLRTSFAYDVNQAGLVKSIHVPTNENKSDHLTKVLQRLKLKAAYEMTGLKGYDTAENASASSQKCHNSGKIPPKFPPFQNSDLAE